MAFYCTFLVSDPAEFELLVGKIITESPLIEEWFIVEGSYSFKGEHKGLRLRAMIESDLRLKPFLSRIKIFEIFENRMRKLSLYENISDLLEKTGRKILRKSTAAVERGRIERKYFEVEKYSRDAPTSKILARANPSDWLFITDVDEIVNASSDLVRNEIQTIINSGPKFFQIQRRRYVYDIDNLDPRFRTVPLVKIELISNNSDLKISSFRFMNNGCIPPLKFPPVIEFSYCFNIEDIRQKLRDFAHLPPSETSIQNALTHNHHLRYDEDPEESIFWFGKDLAIDDFLPDYIKVNYSKFKTNSVNPGYLDARAKDFPRYFSTGKESL